jgi:predicted alpha/beta superfamily hydrolase
VLLSACGGGASAQSKAPASLAQASAQPEVSLLPNLIDMPGLGRKRQVRLYLPPGYATSGKRYPVLYMHDAQNLFDDATAYAGEWKVDETLNALARSGQLELIVVGIDNGLEKRMQELNPWPSSYGAGEGRQYMDFIVNVVKPLIDAQYRTQPGREHTAIMGSSMGGLISHYAIDQYPEVFSKAGIFSPAYSMGPPIFDQAAATRLPQDARLFLLMGGMEGGSMVPDVGRMASVVVQSGLPQQNLVLKVVPAQGHNEGFWSSEFREAVLWMFAPQPAQ